MQGRHPDPNRRADQITGQDIPKIVLTTTHPQETNGKWIGCGSRPNQWFLW